MKKNVIATAPVRADLAGGTLDLWPLGLLHPGGATLAVAISLLVRAQAGPPPHPGAFRLHAQDLGASRDLDAPAIPLTEPLRDGLELLERIARAAGPPAGATLTTRSPVRAGSGLGTSSALGIAAAAALGWPRPRLVDLVRDVEAQILGIPTGTQDHRAALSGGIVILEHTPGGPQMRKAPRPALAALAERLVLVDSGAARSSAPSNWDMFRRRIDGDGAARDALHAVSRAGRAAVDALERADWPALGRAMNDDLAARARWSPLVVTPALARLFDAARAAGALGARVCGAGGGGYAVLLTDPANRADVEDAAAAAVAPERGAVARGVRPVARGLRVTTRPSP